MELGLEDKVAVCLASTSGLGLAVAEALLAEGARVAVSGRDSKRLHGALERLVPDHGQRVWGEVVDVTEPDALAAHLTRVREHWGPIQILVTNSGGPPPGDAADCEDEELLRGLDVTLLSAVRAIRAVLPEMRAAGWGRVLALTSLSVRQPIAGLVGSNTMRAGLTGYLKTLADEVAADGVLVNSIASGLFATGRLEELMRHRAESSGRSFEEECTLAEAGIPMRRFGAPEELGALAAFLVSERCSYLTGVSVAYDGGATRGLF